MITPSTHSPLDPLVNQETSSRWIPSKRTVIGSIAGAALVACASIYPSWLSGIGTAGTFLAGRYVKHEPGPKNRAGIFTAVITSTIVAGLGGAFFNFKKPHDYALLTASLASAYWSTSLTAGLITNRDVPLRTTWKAAAVAATAAAFFGTSVYVCGGWTPLTIASYVYPGFITGFLAYVLVLAKHDNNVYELIRDLPD